MSKKAVYILGLITLIAFPFPVFVVFHYFESISPLTLLDADRLDALPVSKGLVLGLTYALLVITLLKAKFFRSIPNKVEDVVRSMRLTTLDSIFLSLCAGIGEEILFRVGVQHYLGPLITAVLFVAIHGYLVPWNWKLSMYGILVLPFILILSYAMPDQGLWFCVAAHFAYDLVMFTSIRTKKLANE